MKTTDFIKKIVERDCKSILGRDVQVVVKISYDGYAVQIIDYSIGGTLIDFISNNYTKIFQLSPYSDFRICLDFNISCTKD